MLKRLNKRSIWARGALSLLPLTVLPSQEEAKPAKKPELMELQIKVADKKDGSPIDDADVKVMWGQGPESGSGEGITNANGIARVKNVPRGTVVIRVLANGYKTAVPKVDLNKIEQPIRIELQKEAKGKDKEGPPPVNARSSPTVRLIEVAPRLLSGAEWESRRKQLSRVAWNS